MILQRNNNDASLKPKKLFIFWNYGRESISLTTTTTTTTATTSHKTKSQMGKWAEEKEEKRKHATSEPSTQHVHFRSQTKHSNSTSRLFLAGYI
jgi:hypothetical protein